MSFFTKLNRTLSFPQEDKIKSDKPFHEQPQPKEYFVPASVPAPTPEPGPNVPTSTTLNPTEVYIVDFHFDGVLGQPENRFVVGHFSRDDIIESSRSLGDLIEAWSGKDTQKTRSLRWIHIPWNSMKDTESLMKKVCTDIGLTQEAVLGSILSNDKWDDILHNMNNDDSLYASYMQTNCLEIALSKGDLEADGLKEELEARKSRFIHRGANMAIFLPFLHWGTENVLEWRSRCIKKMKKFDQKITGRLPRVSDLATSSCTDLADRGRRFYVNMMATQLLDKTKPLHLRRTLDQWYYSTTCDTSKTRDQDQIVSKFGPDRKKEGTRALLAVDQLWLWLLGGDTVITCFDRRWERDSTFQCNIVDRIIQWTLTQKVKEIRSGYDLTHLILNEVSGFFFNYSSTLPRAIRFHEIFRNAISKLNNDQAKLFQKLAKSYEEGPIWLQRFKSQEKIFALHREFKVVKQVRDLLDELSMIARVYEEQCSTLDALADFQIYDALFRQGLTDETGNAKKAETQRDNVEQDENEESDEPRGDDISNPEPAADSSVSVTWDERYWYRRTKRMMTKYRTTVDSMIAEANDISESLQNTISLKQNSGSLFEAHASRKEAEAIMVFTLVSSIILPLSFFTSIFGMNVAELNNPDNPVTFKVAMAYIVPLSALLLSGFGAIAFQSKVRKFLRKSISFGDQKKKKKRKKGKTEGGPDTEETSEDSDEDSSEDMEREGSRRVESLKLERRSGLFRRLVRPARSEEHEMAKMDP